MLTKRPQNIAKMLPATWKDGWENVWLGTTVENQAEADRRIPHLLAVPARVRFLSCEPLLGPLDLLQDGDGPLANAEPTLAQVDGPNGAHFIRHGASRLDWIIAGGESGPGARPTHIDWFRRLRDQCAAAGVPFLFKQHGDWVALRDQGPGYWPTDGGGCIRMMPDGTRADGGTAMQRVGKKHAGRLLDSVLHDGYPRPVPDMPTPITSAGS